MFGMITRSQARAFSTEALKVVNNVAKQQFAVSKPGAEDAVLNYEVGRSSITFIETQVPEIHKGKGVGTLLAKHAFDYAKTKNLDVTVKCHFLANYYTKNKQKYTGLKVAFDLEEEPRN